MKSSTYNVILTFVGWAVCGFHILQDCQSAHHRGLLSNKRRKGRREEICEGRRRGEVEGEEVR